MTNMFNCLCTGHFNSDHLAANKISIKNIEDDTSERSVTFNSCIVSNNTLKKFAN